MKIPGFEGRGVNGTMTGEDWNDVLCVVLILAFLAVGLMTSCAFGGSCQ